MGAMTTTLGAVGGVATALAAQHLLVGTDHMEVLIPALGVSLAPAHLLKFLPSPASLLLVAFVGIVGAYQIAAHVFHPAVAAVFGGRPKITLTADSVSPGFESVRETIVRDLVDGRLLAVQVWFYTVI
jgi:hypothetical protein